MTPYTPGIHYYHTGASSVHSASPEQLYFFTVYIGVQSVQVELGDSVYYFTDDLGEARVQKGPCTVRSLHLATVVRGYQHPKASVELAGTTTLPYVNGCSTKQLFPPLRPGDPTLQYLHIPGHSHEQQHHIHSTSRVVLIASGQGRCITGLEGHTQSNDLSPGTVVIFDPMTPHHFETTTNQPLVALPLHIFSSVGPQEKNHPMFNGTILL